MFKINSESFERYVGALCASHDQLDFQRLSGIFTPKALFARGH